MYVTLTYDKRDDLIREYQNRPQMWDPTVAGFQDRGYLLAAKHAIAQKFNLESSMYIHTFIHTYIHTEKVVARKIKMYRHNFITAVGAVYKGFMYGYYNLSQ